MSKKTPPVTGSTGFDRINVRRLTIEDRVDIVAESGLEHRTRMKSLQGHLIGVVRHGAIDEERGDGVEISTA